MDLSIADEYKFSALQMAAEAFLVDEEDVVKDNVSLLQALKDGNGHNSKFSDAEVKDFLLHWSVVAQAGNTGTGFSGTLFVCIKDDPTTGAVAGEKVMSFRSTEFVDDDVRDSR